jgi:hypothetical protein
VRAKHIGRERRGQDGVTVGHPVTTSSRGHIIGVVFIIEGFGLQCGGKTLQHWPQLRHREAWRLCQCPPVRFK